MLRTVAIVLASMTLVGCSVAGLSSSPAGGPGTPAASVPGASESARVQSTPSLLASPASAVHPTAPAGSPATAASAPATSPAASPAPTSAAADATPTAAPTPAAAALTSATWTKLRSSDAPSPREDHTWTVDEAGAKAYVFGGRAGGAVHGDLWAYDLTRDEWTEIDVVGPDPRFGHEAVWLPGRGLVIFAGQAGPRFFNDLWLFDPETGSWTELPAAGDVPAARYGSCAALGRDGRLWISHGFTQDGVRFSDTRAYDFASGTWTDVTPTDGDRPVERCLHGCWFDATGNFVLFGGQTTGVRALGDLWVLEAPGDAASAWRQIEAELPADRNLYAHATAADRRLVFGGQGRDGSLDDLWAFDLASGAIHAVPAEGDVPPARWGAELIADTVRGRLLLFGGRHEGGTFRDLWQLTLE